MMVFDHHVHLEHGPYTPHDYPKAWVAQYFETGRVRDVSGIGLVEHAYRFTEAKGLLPGEWSAARCRYSLQTYYSEMRHLREGFGTALGLEMDFVPEHVQQIHQFLQQFDWDFVLGSVHFLGEFGIDVKEMTPYYDQWGPETVWQRYYETSIAAVQSDLFDVITHPDLPKLYGHPKPSSQFLAHWYQQFCDALNAHNVAIEINTAGLRRPINEIYPESALLEYAYQANVPITIGSDAHEPENVGIFFEQAVALARSVGYREAWGFVNGEKRAIPFDMK